MDCFFCCRALVILTALAQWTPASPSLSKSTKNLALPLVRCLTTRTIIPASSRRTRMHYFLNRVTCGAVHCEKHRRLSQYTGNIRTYSCVKDAGIMGSSLEVLCLKASPKLKKNIIFEIQSNHRASEVCCVGSCYALPTFFEPSAS